MLSLQVLMKGIYARPVPIIVKADIESGVNASTLRIDDRWGDLTCTCLHVSMQSVLL